MSDAPQDSLPLDNQGSAWLQVAGLVVVAMLAPSALAVVLPASHTPGVPGLWQVLLSGVVLLAYAAWCVRADASPRASLGLASRLGWRALPLGVVIALVAFVAAALILSCVQFLMPDGGAMERREQALDAFRSIPLPRALLMALWAGIYEEIVARGFLLDRLRKGLAYSGVPTTWWLPVVLGAWLFALGHVYQGPVGVAQTFAAGLLFSLATRLDSGVVAAMVAHVIVDGGSFLMLRYAA